MSAFHHGQGDGKPLANRLGQDGSARPPSVLHVAWVRRVRQLSCLPWRVSRLSAETTDIPCCRFGSDHEERGELVLIASKRCGLRALNSLWMQAGRSGLRRATLRAQGG